MEMDQDLPSHPDGYRPYCFPCYGRILPLKVSHKCSLPFFSLKEDLDLDVILAIQFMVSDGREDS